MGYGVPTYVADMVTLVARLDVEQVDWVGTLMGGLIGLGLARMPGSPVRRLVLNDVGPAIQPEAIRRIAHVTSASRRTGARWTKRPTRCGPSRRGFGPHTREQWLALTRPQLVPDRDHPEGGYKPHYDPAIAVPFRAITPELAAAGDSCCGRATTA